MKKVARDFFLENGFLKLLSVGVATVLWFVVLGSRNVEETKEIAIELLTAPDLVVSNEVPDKVVFRMSGPKAFLRSVLDRREDPIRVNLTAAKAGLVTYRFFSDNIKLPIGVKVQSIQPTAILVKLEEVGRKEVPAKLELRGALPDGFRLSAAEIIPSRVKLKGPVSRLSQVSEVVALPVDLSGMTADLSRSALFDLSRQKLILDQEAPEIRIRVEPVSANFKIKNLAVEVARNSSLLREKSSTQPSVNPPVATLLVRAPNQVVSRLDRSQVTLFVQAQGLKAGKHRLKVQAKVPDGVAVVKVVPAEVEVRLFD